MKCKKILAPVDLRNPNKIIKGYLYPNPSSDETPNFLTITNQKEWEVGVVVFLGKEISRDDLFAKIIDAGNKIDSVEKLLINLQNYLEQLENFKIGNLVGITKSGNGWELVKLQKPLQNNNQ